MIEYIYDLIKATSGEDIQVSAKITDDSGAPIASGCGLRLFSKEQEFITRIEGTFDGEMWNFDIPRELTKEMKGKYYYCMCRNGEEALSFRKPIYFE